MPRALSRLAPALMLAPLLAVAACARGPSAGASVTPLGGEAASRMHVASVAESSGRPEIALAMYRAAAQQEPNNRMAQARYAAALARTGDLVQAKLSLANALRTAPDDPALLRGMGTLELLAGQPKEAEALFRRILSINSSDPRAQGGLAVALDLEGRAVEAQAAHRAAYAADPANLGFANNLAVSLMLAGKSREAVGVLEPLRFRSDVPQRLLTNLALAQTASGAAANGQDPRAVLEAQASRPQIETVLAALADRAPQP